MDISGGKSTGWDEGGGWGVTRSGAESAAAAGAQSEAAAAGALPAAAVAGVALLVLVAIAAVFLLGVFIDCRHQKIVEKKMGITRRQKNRRTVETEIESATIAVNMQPAGESAPPAPACVVRLEP